MEPQPWEETLRQFRPRSVDEPGLHFAVGYARGKRRLTVWKIIACTQLLLLLAAGGTIAWLARKPPELVVRIQERIVTEPVIVQDVETVPMPSIPESEEADVGPIAKGVPREPPTPTDGLARYWELRDNILSSGISLLPSSPQPPRPRLDHDEWEQMMGITPPRQAPASDGRSSSRFKIFGAFQ